MDYSTRFKLPNFKFRKQKKAAAKILDKVLLDTRLKPLTDLIHGTGSDFILVGGAVRDALLYNNLRRTDDFDFVTSFPLDDLADLLDDAVPTIGYFRIGTLIRIYILGIGQIDITSYSGSDLKTNLSKRDFTINSIGYSYTSGRFIDPLNGIRDVLDGTLRASYNAYKMFADDPIRILRFGMYKSEPYITKVASEFSMADAAILCAWRLDLKQGLVTPPRLAMALVRVLKHSNAADLLQFFSRIGVLSVVIPELTACYNLHQNKYHSLDVFDHIVETVRLVREETDNPVLLLAALLHDIGKPETLTTDENGCRHFFGHEATGAKIASDILTRLRFGNYTTDAVTKLVLEHMRPIDDGLRSIRRLVRDLGTQLDYWLTLKQADRRAGHTNLDNFTQEWNTFLENLNTVHLEHLKCPVNTLNITGKDLIEQCGLNEGPAIGKVLSYLKDQVLEEPLDNNRERLLELAEKFLAAAER